MAIRPVDMFYKYGYDTLSGAVYVGCIYRLYSVSPEFDISNVVWGLVAGHLIMTMISILMWLVAARKKPSMVSIMICIISVAVLWGIARHNNMHIVRDDLDGMDVCNLEDRRTSVINLLSKCELMNTCDVLNYNSTGRSDLICRGIGHYNDKKYDKSTVYSCIHTWESGDREVIRWWCPFMYSLFR